jgi:hypothetical protein
MSASSSGAPGILAAGATAMVVVVPGAEAAGEWDTEGAADRVGLLPAGTVAEAG